jgi:hypothetical protein
MLTAQGGDCAIYHGHGLESASQFRPGSKAMKRFIDLDAIAA